MDINNISLWLINWFQNNSDIKSEEIKLNLESNYFEMQWLDSYELINLISSIEEHFNITFSNDEFQNREFSTITGLTKIINGKINGKL